MECSRCYEHFDIDNMTEVDIYFLCEDCFRHRRLLFNPYDEVLEIRGRPSNDR